MESKLRRLLGVVTLVLSAGLVGLTACETNIHADDDDDFDRDRDIEVEVDSEMDGDDGKVRMRVED